MNSTDIISSRRFVGAIDLHSHPLPGIDDGATDIKASVMMLCVAARYGTWSMVATPHRYYGGRQNRPELIKQLVTQVREAIKCTHFGQNFELLPGQEIPLTLNTGKELKRGEVLTIADRGVYALVEPPFEQLHPWTSDAISAIVQAGYLPILAHPERNSVVQLNPEVVVAFVEAGALLQLTAMSVSGANGDLARLTSEWIIEHGLASIIASDTHSPIWRSPDIRSAYHAVKTKFGIELARRLCIENPSSILQGNAI